MPQSIDLLQEDGGTMILEQLVENEASRLILEQLDDGIGGGEAGGTDSTRSATRELRRRRR